MPSDVPSLRYVLPFFRNGYTAGMKTLTSSCAFDASDIAKYRLKVLEFGKVHGWKAVKDAFGVSRSTFYLWSHHFKKQRGTLSSLIPHSTKPHRLRHMVYDPRLALFIKSIREQYGRVGKYKLEVLVAAYAAQLGIPPLKANPIGKLIKRHPFYFEGRRRYKRSRQGILRVKKAPREKSPGYIEMDTVILRMLGETHCFITAIDVYTKYAQALYAKTALSSKSLELLMAIHHSYPFPLRAIQTDNGSEFLGAFEGYCQSQEIPHYFTYPRSPKINGGVERFNRTIQEEFLDRTDALILSPDIITQHLNRYLNWYNTQRPHQSLGYRSPNQYIQVLQSNM